MSLIVLKISVLIKICIKNCTFYFIKATFILGSINISPAESKLTCEISAIITMGCG